jgi:hypothetical protein
MFMKDKIKPGNQQGYPPCKRIKERSLQTTKIPSHYEEQKNETCEQQHFPSWYEEQKIEAFEQQGSPSIRNTGKKPVNTKLTLPHRKKPENNLVPLPNRLSPEGPCPGPHVGGGGEGKSLRISQFLPSTNYNQSVTRPPVLG